MFSATGTTKISSDYVLGGFGLYSVDCSNESKYKYSCAARYINHASDAPNVSFQYKSGSRGEAIAVALREIAPGEELYVDYGSGYWKNRKSKT